jgi:beta-lactamase class C
MTTDERLAPLGDLVGRMVRTEGVHGAAVAVVARGKLIHEEYAGIAAPGRPASAETIWPLASITKLYTAAMIVRLIEQGALTLSTRIATILPRMTGGGRETITLRQLLTHTSGLIYESPEMPALMTAQTGLNDMVDEAYSSPLLYQPGTSQLYSDLGYALAGRLAATAMQSDYAQLVRELVLAPANLNETFLPVPAHVDDQIASISGAFAEGTDGAMYNSRYSRELSHPAFGAAGNLRDLLALGLLFTPYAPKQLFTAAGLRTMVSDQTGGDLPGERVAAPVGVIHPWGLGPMIKGRSGTPELVSPESFGHAGATGCILWVDPIQDVVIAFVSNRHLNSDPDAFFFRLDRVVNVTMANLSRR